MLFSHFLTPKHPLCAGYRSKHGDTEGGKVEPSFVELMFSWRESEADRQLSNRVILICQGGDKVWGENQTRQRSQKASRRR